MRCATFGWTLNATSSELHVCRVFRSGMSRSPATGRTSASRTTPHPLRWSGIGRRCPTSAKTWPTATWHPRTAWDARTHPRMHRRRPSMHNPIRTALAMAAAAALAGSLLAVAAGTASAAGSGLEGDFNGDGYRDLAIGVPNGEDGFTDAG